MPRDPTAMATSPPAGSETPHVVQRLVGRRGDVVEPRLVERDADPVEQDLVAHGTRPASFHA